MSTAPPYRTAVRGALLLLAAAGSAGAAYILFEFAPTDDSYYPRCQLHSLTGLHCPGCGTTRALHAALNGRFAQALAYNALAFIVLPVVGWSFCKSLWYWQRRRPIEVARRAATWTWILLASLLIYTILRNVPYYPFTLLAPHEI